MPPARIVSLHLELRPRQVGGHAAVEVRDKHLRPARLLHREPTVLDDQFGEGAASIAAESDGRERLSLGVDPILDRRMTKNDPARGEPAAQQPTQGEVGANLFNAPQIGELDAGPSWRVRPVTPAEFRPIHHLWNAKSPS